MANIHLDFHINGTAFDETSIDELRDKYAAFVAELNEYPRKYKVDSASFSYSLKEDLPIVNPEATDANPSIDNN